MHVDIPGNLYSNNAMKSKDILPLVIGFLWLIAIFSFAAGILFPGSVTTAVASVSFLVATALTIGAFCFPSLFPDC